MWFAILSLLLVLLTSGLTASVQRLAMRPANIILIFIAAYASIVLIAEVLGSIHALDNRLAWLTLQFILLGVIVVLWWRRGRPSLPFRLSLPSRTTVIQAFKKHPILWGLGMSVVGAYLVGAWLVLYVPPNNYDGLSYHLPKIGYWLQFDSLFPWMTPNVRQTTFPINAELGMLWTFLLRGTDQLAGFVQWSAALISAVGVYGITRMMRFTRAQSLFPALLYLTLSQVHLQSTTVQNDLVISAFFVSGFYLFLIGWRYENRGALISSSIAFALGVGTKSTAAFALPGLLVAILTFWVSSTLSQRRLMVFWGAVCLCSTLIFGSYIYVLNTIAYGNPLGAGEFVESMTSSSFRQTSDDENVTQIHYSRMEMLAINVPRYFAQLADFTSLGNVGQELSRIKYDLFQRLFANTPVATAGTANNWDWQTTLSYWWGAHEDTAWFGPLGFVVFLPGVVYGLYRGWRHRDPIALSIALVPILFLLMHSMSQPYTPAKGRYYVLAVTFGAPLMIWPTLSIQKKSKLLCLVVSILAVITLYMNTFYNASKPLLGENAVFDRDYVALQIPSQQFAPLVHLVNKYIPEDGRLGIFGHGDLREYPFFGPRLTRNLIPYVIDSTKVDAFSLRQLEEQGPEFLIRSVSDKPLNERLDGFLMTQDYFDRFAVDTSGFELIANVDGHYLYRSLRPDSVRSENFREDFDNLPPGANWHYQEGSIANLMWTSDTQATIAARRLIEASSYQLTMRVAYAITPEIGASLSLQANQQPLELGEPDENGVYRASIPPEIIEAADGWLALAITTDAVISPKELGASEDVRQLGVALDYLVVEAETSEALDR